MSGHSKWATIKRKKGAIDAKRGKIFTKIIKELMVAAKMGGGSDPEGNPRLKSVVLKAKAVNMPKDNIDRAIKKGAGETAGADYVELNYEAYGPNGVAVLIETLTDNKNRTAADVRAILNKANGSLATSGAVSRLFSRKGLITFDGEKYKEDDILAVALEAGAEDVVAEGGSIDVTTTPEDFEKVLTDLNKAGFEQEVGAVSMVPMDYVTLDKESAEKVMGMIERLEDNDDVQNVYHNLDTSVLEGEGEE